MVAVIIILALVVIFILMMIGLYGMMMKKNLVT